MALAMRQFASFYLQMSYLPLLEYKWSQLECRIATSLAGMQPVQGARPSPSRHSSSTQSSGATSSAGVTCSAPNPEAVRQQLASLLQRRTANDMQARHFPALCLPSSMYTIAEGRRLLQPTEADSREVAMRHMEDIISA